MDLVSIIIPVYNGEKYIEKCLNSLLGQTYKNIELVIVNDGSKDNSLAVLETFAEKDSRIKVLSKENGGVSSARNAGLENATGKYICFVDIDDFVEPEYVQVLYEGMKQKDCMISACNIFYRYAVDFVPENSETYGVFTIQEAFYQLCRNGIVYPFMWNKMFSADTIKENALRFDTSMTYSEDTLFWFNYCSCIYDKKMAYAGNKKLYHYVQNPNSAMNSRIQKGFSQKWFDQLNCLDYASDFAKSKGHNDFAKVIKLRKGKLCGYLADLCVCAKYRGKEYKDIINMLREILPNILESDYYSDRLKGDLKLCAKSPVICHYVKNLRGRIEGKK